MKRGLLATILACGLGFGAVGCDEDDDDVTPPKVDAKAVDASGGGDGGVVDTAVSTDVVVGAEAGADVGTGGDVAGDVATGGDAAGDVATGGDTAADTATTGAEAGTEAGTAAEAGAEAGTAAVDWSDCAKLQTNKVTATAEEICTHYMSKCGFGAGDAAKPKFADKAACLARYASYTTTQKECTTYHMCVAATNAAHCPHPVGPGTESLNPCSLP